MAYSLPLVAPSNFILKLKIHCSKCENKLKRMLLRVAGVHSVSIDAKQGTVAISGNVEPSTILMLLEKGVGRKAELLWEQSPSASSTSSKLDGQNLEIIAESKVVDELFNDPNVVAQLERLSGIQGLTNIQVTYSKTIKLSFKGEKDDLSDKNVQVTARDQGSGIFCEASASCCGGHNHGGVNRNVHGYGIGGCCGNHAAGYPIASYVCPVHSCDGNSYWPPHACGSVPPPAPQPPCPGCSPSAPPLGTTYDTPPPPTSMGYSYFSPFSDDNLSSGCNII
ncbi:unnamed protein product [Coffea canephora]|uniref:HMA domain-containing protein n=1 Tax=Coffea canephora TaxID=49390 RepID=A0A068TUW1_COFCA|nr:unnamed protein product [Coffea canephora]